MKYQLYLLNRINNAIVRLQCLSNEQSEKKEREKKKKNEQKAFYINDAAHDNNVVTQRLNSNL